MKTYYIHISCLYQLDITFEFIITCTACKKSCSWTVISLRNLRSINYFSEILNMIYPLSWIFVCPPQTVLPRCTSCSVTTPIILCRMNLTRTLLWLWFSLLKRSEVIYSIILFPQQYTKRVLVWFVGMVIYKPRLAL